MTDFPDYTQHAFIDIVAQTLGRVLTRPTYGGAISSNIALTVASASPTTLFDISGEGIIYGGYLWVDAIATAVIDKWLWYIDGNLQNSLRFDRLFDNNCTQPYGAAPVLTRYDEVNYDYGLIWVPAITFESGFIVQYSESYGRTPDVRSGVSYALV